MKGPKDDEGLEGSIKSESQDSLTALVLGILDDPQYETDFNSGMVHSDGVLIAGEWEGYAHRAINVLEYFMQYRQISYSGKGLGRGPWSIEHFFGVIDDRFNEPLEGSYTIYLKKGKGKKEQIMALATVRPVPCGFYVSQIRSNPEVKKAPIVLLQYLEKIAEKAGARFIGMHAGQNPENHPARKLKYEIHPSGVALYKWLARHPLPKVSVAQQVELYVPIPKEVDETKEVYGQFLLDIFLEKLRGYLPRQSDHEKITDYFKETYNGALLIAHMPMSPLPLRERCAPPSSSNKVLGLSHWFIPIGPPENMATVVEQEGSPGKLIPLVQRIKKDVTPFST